MLDYKETVMKMICEKDIERWYLGLPFQENDGEETEVSTPLYLSDDEVERLALGLPLAAA